MTVRRIDFNAVNAAALRLLPSLVQRWAPGGVVRGAEYIVRNPTRPDRKPGSFKINIETGRWADFATGDSGGDVVSLVAYLRDMSQADAARRLMVILGVPNG